MTDFLDSPLKTLKGVGEKTENLFNKMGVYTVRDILSFFPREFKEYPHPKTIDDLNVGEMASVLGMVIRPIVVRRFRKFSISLGVLETENGVIEVVWYNMPYIKNTINRNMPYIFYGKVSEKNGVLRIEQPALFEPGEYENIRKKPVPIYRQTKGLKNKAITKVVTQALSGVDEISDDMPSYLLEKRNLLSLSSAIKLMHSPDSLEDLVKARDRFAYTELLEFFLEAKSLENGMDVIPNHFNLEKHEITDKVKSCLPFELTEGQEEAISDIFSDFSSEYITERLIQGDVGCGKTVVSFIAMLRMAENGYQSALMAPTEVLATQHYEGFLSDIEKYDLDFKVALLTGSTSKKDKDSIYERLASGDIDFVIGTHALIQDKVSFKKLGLVITDEQHRFGVKQRKVFSDKGDTPFSILLSATPIPRTLALVLYDGMNITQIRTLPKNRQKIKTAVVDPSLRTKSWQMIVSEIQKGRQAYIVCPLVSESENSEGENVIDYEMKLKEVLPDSIKTSVLHGKMKPDEKEEVISRFASGEISILVSTTVIEVGVNVPNATIMMIEDAQRFGLSSLHQLRGRVGRGADQSFCILVNSAPKQNENAKKRLMCLKESNDGFFIAEEDLKLRGPGDFRGIRQSGEMGFTIVDIYQDANLLNEAKEDCEEILKEDPALKKPENQIFLVLKERGKNKIFTNL
ncbi:MAG: ATP-dependent DNA helicase RecG [Lachnospiraceae bacterium]|nr:ATP-dependent DNA helicase RecG [Lachnospiraceae bacterium]